MHSSPKLAYGKVAGAYDAFLAFTGFKRGVKNFLSRLQFDLPPRARILDAGCGTGLVACYLADRFPEAEICAFDIDTDMLRAMARRVAEQGLAKRNILLAHGNLQKPGHLRMLKTQEPVLIPNGYFDAIFVSGALEHVPLAETLPKLARLLKHGGMLLNISVKRNPAGAVLGMVYRFRPYRLAELRQAFSDAGLQEIRTLRLSVEDFPANLSRIAILARKVA